MRGILGNCDKLYPDLISSTKMLETDPFSPVICQAGSAFSYLNTFRIKSTQTRSTCHTQTDRHSFTNAVSLFLSRDHQVTGLICCCIVLGQIGDIKTAEKYFQDVEEVCQMKGSQAPDKTCVLMNR